MTASFVRGIESTRRCSSSFLMIQWIMASINWILLLGFFLHSKFFKLNHKFSLLLLLRSGLFPGHSNTLMLFCWNNYLTLLAVWHGAPSCWNKSHHNLGASLQWMLSISVPEYLFLYFLHLSYLEQSEVFLDKHKYLQLLKDNLRKSAEKLGVLQNSRFTRILILSTWPMKCVTCCCTTVSKSFKSRHSHRI